MTSATVSASVMKWLAVAWEGYKKEWGKWSLFTLVSAALVIISSVIPFLSLVLQPIAFVFIMAAAFYGAHLQYNNGGKLERFGQLFEGMGRAPGKLVLLGLLSMAITALMLFGIGMAGALAGLLGGDEESIEAAMVLYGAITVLITVSVQFAMLYAPLIFAISPERPFWEGVKLSLSIIFGNFWTFVRYSFLMLALLLLVLVIPTFGLAYFVVIPLSYLAAYVGYMNIVGGRDPESLLKKEGEDASDAPDQASLEDAQPSSINP